MQTLKRLKYLLLILLLVSISSTLSGQNADSLFYKNHSRINGKYIGSYFSGLKNVAIAPFSWNEQDWTIFGGFIVTEASLFAFDKQLQPSFSHPKPIFDAVNTYFFDPLGKGLIVLPLMGVLYLYGIPSHNNRLQFTALSATKAWGLTAVYTYAIKFLFQRERPQSEGDYNPYIFHGPTGGFQEDYLSFISGHTSTVFAVATVFASEYRDIKWVPWVSYGVATLTAFSRIYDNKHWASDVLPAALMGFAIGKMVWRNDRGMKKNRQKLSYAPLFLPNGGGVIITLNI